MVVRFLGVVVDVFFAGALVVAAFVVAAFVVAAFVVAAFVVAAFVVAPSWWRSSSRVPSWR